MAKNKDAVDPITEAVDLILSSKPDEVKTLKDNDEMWMYHKKLGYWLPDMEDYITTLCSKNPGVNTTSAYANVVMGVKGRTWCYRNEPDEYDDEGHHTMNGFKQIPGYINLRNGVLELSSMTLLPHDKTYNFSSRLEIDYVQGADCPKFKKFLNDIIPDKEDQEFIQEWFGYQIDDTMLAQKFLACVGAAGSGKSILFKVMSALIGQENIIANSLQDIEKDRWSIAEFYGKKANIYLDMSNDMIYDVGKLKMLTSGIDLVKGEKKHRDPFYFYNSCKITVTCNKLPPLAQGVEMDDAFWRRAMVFVFKVQVPDSAKKNPEILLAELTTPEELSGILNWALDGLKRLKTNKDFSYNMENNYQSWKDSVAASNPVSDFFNEYFVIGNANKVIKEDAWNKYLEWCEMQRAKGKKILQLAQRSFGINMKWLGANDTTGTDANDKTVAVYGGICWNSKPDSQPVDNRKVFADKFRLTQYIKAVILSEWNFVRKPIGMDDSGYMNLYRELVRNVNADACVLHECIMAAFDEIFPPVIIVKEQ